MCANFGDLRSRDRKLRHQKTLKNGNFWPKNLLIRLELKKPLGEQSWNLYTMWVFINGLSKLSLGVPSHMTKILKAKNWLNWTILNQYISININFDGK